MVVSAGGGMRSAVPRDLERTLKGRSDKGRRSEGWAWASAMEATPSMAGHQHSI